jgi:hypothetical protein
MPKLKDNKMVFALLVDVVGLLQCREIISAWAGLKVARIGVKSSKLKSTFYFLAKLNLFYHEVPELVYLKRDIGKGGWSNKFDERQNLSLDKGDHIIYIANSEKVLKKAVNADHNGDEGEFGSNLGIPQCCIDFYLANQEKAYQKQNDFVTLVVKNTEALHSFNFWNNYISQYFGYSLLSFFPCSFQCNNAAHMAQNTYELMLSILPELTLKIVHFQKQPILYTEYRGIYLFEGAESIKGKTLVKNCTIHSTLNQKSKTHLLISKTKEIEVLEKEKMNLVSNFGDEKIIKSSDWAMCTFV